MRSRKASLLILILLISLSLNSCANKSTQGASNSIKQEKMNDMELPCLAYLHQGDQVTAVKATWDITNGKLDIKNDDKVFSFDDENSYKIPEYWDGWDNFIIPDFCRPYAKYKKTIKLIPIPLPSNVNSQINIGDNIELEKIQKDTGELEIYRIAVKKDGNVITREVKFDLYYKNDMGKKLPLDPIGDLSFVYYDGNDVYFTYVRTPGNYFSLFVVKYNIATEEKTVNEIKFPEDSIDFQTIFLQDEVENIKEKFYAPTVDGVGLVDLYDNTFVELDDITNKCKNYIKSTMRGEEPGYFVIHGIYNDEVLVLGVPVHTGKSDDEILYCAIKLKDNQIIGAIYKKDQTLFVMDHNKNIKSRINMQEAHLTEDVPLLAFPGKNGLNWS